MVQIDGKIQITIDFQQIPCIIALVLIKGNIMKKNIHPEYHEIDVTMTDGKTVKMYSAVKKNQVLSIDNLNHSAWTGQRQTVDKGQRAAEFKKKFGDFKF